MTDKYALFHKNKTGSYEKPVPFSIMALSFIQLKRVQSKIITAGLKQNKTIAAGL